MRYSLLNRFRGALLGSFVGKTLASGGGKDQFINESRFTLPHSRETQPSPTPPDWSEIAMCGTKSLIHCGKLDLDDWVRYCEMTQPSLLLLQSTASSSEAAVATLPVALFFHEDEAKLRQQLLQAATVWRHDSQTSEEVLVVAFAIALALTEKLNPATLIPRILNYLNPSQTPLVQQLEQVQTLLEKGAGLDTTLTQLRCHAPKSQGELKRSCLSIALALYCFLHTPEDFRLCVTRAIRTGYQPQLTATLTGTLAGVYNSIIGIPVGWQLASQQIPMGVQWMQLAERLFAVWSGIYDVSVAEQFPSVAIAAPRVIQPR
ncbi:MAG: ADP-ribosylglycohydrolase family protein [Symplocastrum torsivum CPER-KK1]|uniref:ADP-ribosylglycohydrolase family protein n=1 Tax=Symplocastrum torsivum CPER-KK1 TaxID=450513 RepID=A0A951PFR4_9CYAN|nr:ADP-ribosylglycohydrolase family protein [Symplocastrum torsivum CPER-KK1]